jgi:hypothetical protein
LAGSAGQSGELAQPNRFYLGGWRAVVRRGKFGVRASTEFFTTEAQRHREAAGTLADIAGLDGIFSTPRRLCGEKMGSLQDNPARARNTIFRCPDLGHCGAGVSPVHPIALAGSVFGGFGREPGWPEPAAHRMVH